MLPHGVGAYISPITMKAYLTANFNDGWIDGFGRKNSPDGTIIEGHYKRSQLNGLGLIYDQEPNTFESGIYLKGRLSELRTQGENYPGKLAAQLGQKIHQRSINYLNQTMNWKKLLGIDINKL